MKRLTDKPFPVAVVLLSGGMDSATVLAHTTGDYACYALSFSYGQKNAAELAAAKLLARQFSVKKHVIFPVDLAAFGGSALTDANIPVPKEMVSEKGVPSTYVPARNLVFLSLALSWAETLESRHIFIGANAVDFSGYPDCRPEFIQSFQETARLATRSAEKGYSFIVHAPLMQMGKAEIILLGTRLGVDYSQTVSCYSASASGLACAECEACCFRRKGFAQAGIPDPTRYQ